MADIFGFYGLVAILISQPLNLLSSIWIYKETILSFLLVVFVGVKIFEVALREGEDLFHGWYCFKMLGLVILTVCLFWVPVLLVEIFTFSLNPLLLPYERDTYFHFHLYKFLLSATGKVNSPKTSQKLKSSRKNPNGDNPNGPIQMERVPT